MTTTRQSKTYIKVTNGQKFVSYIKRENDIHTLTPYKEEALIINSNFERLPYSIDNILEVIKNDAEDIYSNTSYNGVAYYIFNKIDIQEAIKKQLGEDFKIEIVTEISENIEICE